MVKTSKTDWRELEFGDIIMINFSPSKGHEQKGYRPGLVLSDPAGQRDLKGLTTVALITKTSKEFFTRVPMNEGLNEDLNEVLDEGKNQISGNILMDQIKVLDLNERQFRYIEKASDRVLSSCKEIFCAIYEKFLDS